MQVRKLLLALVFTLGVSNAAIAQMPETFGTWQVGPYRGTPGDFQLVKVKGGDNPQGIGFYCFEDGPEAMFVYDPARRFPNGAFNDTEVLSLSITGGARMKFYANRLYADDGHDVFGFSLNRATLNSIFNSMRETGPSALIYVQMRDLQPDTFFLENMDDNFQMTPFDSSILETFVDLCYS